MTRIDWPTLINWIVGGAISFCFGLTGAFVGALANDKLQRRREAEAEERRKREAIRQSLTNGVEKFAERGYRRRHPLLPEEISIRRQFLLIVDLLITRRRLLVLGFAVGAILALLSLTLLRFWK